MKRAIIVCPTSLVGNWDSELTKWLKNRIRCVAVTQSGPEKINEAISEYLNPRTRTNVLIISYDTFRRYAENFYEKSGSENEEKCGLLICDEVKVLLYFCSRSITCFQAHRLKNAKTETYKALDKLSCKKRILLSGTPMQNDLDEFFAMV